MSFVHWLMRFGHGSGTCRKPMCAWRWHLHFALPSAALQQVLGAGVGSLQRDSCVRNLMQVKMHLTLMQQRSLHSLSCLSLPSLWSATKCPLKGTVQPHLWTQPYLCHRAWFSKETSSIGWNSVLQLDLFLVYCVSNSAVSLSVCQSPPAVARLVGASGVMQDLERVLYSWDFSVPWTVLMSEWCWGAKRSLLSCAMRSWRRRLGVEYCGYGGENFPLVQRPRCQVWILQRCLDVPERSSPWGRKGEWNREMIKW